MEGKNKSSIVSSVEAYSTMAFGKSIRCLNYCVSVLYFICLDYGILDLCNKSIRKLDKSIIPPNVLPKNVITVNLTGNCLQRLDNIDIFSELIEVCKNAYSFF